jgi:hypothetical protein
MSGATSATMAAVDGEIARRTLSGVDDLRRTARARLFAFWFPMQVFGAAMLGAGLGGLAFGGVVLALLQTSASILATVTVTVFYRRRGLRTGIRRRSWPFATVSAVGFALCIAAASLLPTHPADVSSWLAAAVVCVAFAVIERNGVAVLWAAAIGGVAAAFSALAPTAPVGSVTSVEGGIGLVAGTTLLVLRHRRA